ncbi:MAG TPA: ABC transporter permease [Thermoanaerobaculia bacterium]|nr:ABC transporter permease [Thermoanaerobaculia bacterium]
MTTLRTWAVRLASLFRRRQLDERLDEEIRFHLEMQARENQARGMSPEEARRTARHAFGQVEALKEAYRERRGVPALETLARDLRYAVRMLRKSPGFTAVALLSLAFGVGANCAIFGVVDALLLKSLPVAGAERLVALSARLPSGELFPLFSYPAYERLAAARPVCSGLVAFTDQFRATVRPEGAAEAATPGRMPETANAALVSANFFSLLGVGTASGRTFGAEEGRPPGPHPVAVMSYGYWQRRYGRDPRVVGRALRVNGAAVTVVGVAARGFTGLFADAAPDLFLPLTLHGAVKHRGNFLIQGSYDEAAPPWRQPNAYWLTLVAKRRPGVGERQAAAALGVIFQAEKEAEAALQLTAQDRRDILAEALVLRPAGRGLADSRATLTAPLMILSAVAGLVLLIACANLANLLLARADRRRTEMAVRLGIGAGRGRLVRQLLTESLLLAGLGGVLGLLFAWWGSRLLVGLVQGNGQTLALDVAIDGRKLAFAAAVALLTGIAFGLAPALRATRIDIASSLKQGAAAAGGGAAGHRGGRRRMPLGRLLVVAQVGLSLPLLIGAGLFVRSLRNLMRVDTGFARLGLVQVTIRPGLLGYDDGRLAALYDRLVERIEALPGVRSVSLSDSGLLGTSWSVTDVEPPSGAPGAAPARDESINVQRSTVTWRFFATAGMRMAQGRGFAPQDREGAPKVAVINETLARRLFSPARAVGHRLRFKNPRFAGCCEVVGVVRDAKYHEVTETAPPVVYLPVTQSFEQLNAIQVRAAPGAGTAGAALAESLRRAAAETDPNLAVFSIATIDQQLARSLSYRSAVAKLIGFFGLLALLLAATGLYGVMAYSVARRTSEIGLRMALGAPRGLVLRLVLRETARLIGLGVAAGLAAALAATRAAASQLFGVSAFDPATVLAATAALALVALAAGFLPARRAAHTDPAVALRGE